jgi:F-box interacting protein
LKILNTDYGDEVKRVRRYLGYCSLDSMSHERMVCVTHSNRRIGLLDPATGAMSVLPDHEPLPGAYTCCTIGRGASSGEHKVLALSIAPSTPSEACKILTLSGGDHCWRETGSPPLEVVKVCIDFPVPPSMIVPSSTGFPIINGVAFILGYVKDACAAHQMVMELDLECDTCEQDQMIMAFDLDCEAWRPAFLQAPPNLLDVTLAELQDQLVAGFQEDDTAIQLWFLVDLERSIWSKRYTITMPGHQNLKCEVYCQKPLAMLDDGRIVMWMRPVYDPKDNSTDDTFLRIYNPRTETFVDGTILPKCNRVTMFTWSLLNSGQRGALDRVARLAVIKRRHILSGAAIKRRHNCPREG